ncbi:DUF4179 domain-containing protein [Gorillibacterium massiliense]|uniref:DUF4179 domain-containing protein n=1 Tax=Gorillibacterium massiliense TaxID=1280390 RepID=UPI0004ACAA41|nr:DUF4179 domain-containing protein [Gorillibacterium massiliense]
MNNINEDRFHGIEVPFELTDAIRKGISRAEPKIKRRNHLRMAMRSISTAAALLAAFVAMMNISPAIANAVTERLPVLSPLVVASWSDKGLDAAIKNDYVFQNAVQVTDNGVTFAVQDIVADEKMITLSYKVTIEEGHESFANLIPRRMLINYNGKEEQMDFTVDPDNPHFAQTKTMEGIAQYRWDLDKEAMPDKVTVTTDEIDDYQLFIAKRVPQQVTEADKQDATYKKYGRAPYTVAGNWSLQLDLSGLKKLAPKIYPDVMAKNGTETFSLKNIEITPTVTMMVFDGGEYNNNWIEDLHPYLEDEKGVKYRLNAASAQDGYPLLSFESSYFSESHDLTLVLKDNGSPDSKPIRIKLNQR